MNYKEVKYNRLIIIVIAMIYLLNNMLLKKYVMDETIRLFCICYLNDIMCPSILLASTNIFIEIIKKLRKSNIYWNKVIIFIERCVNSLLGNLIYCFSAGVYWEYIYQHGTEDINDMICYMLGGLIYYLLIKCKFY